MDFLFLPTVLMRVEEKATTIDRSTGSRPRHPTTAPSTDRPSAKPQAAA
jgi:hypothetical protein